MIIYVFSLLFRYWIFRSAAWRAFCKSSEQSDLKAKGNNQFLFPVLGCLINWPSISRVLYVSLICLMFSSFQPYYRYADTMNPDVWFEPAEVNSCPTLFGLHVWFLFDIATLLCNYSLPTSVICLFSIFVPHVVCWFNISMVTPTMLMAQHKNPLFFNYFKQKSPEI